MAKKEARQPAEEQEEQEEEQEEQPQQRQASVYDLAIRDGMKELVKKHPRFSGLEGYLSQHIDSSKLRKVIEDTNNYLGKKKNLSDKERQEIMYKKVADYVTSGNVLDDAGKEVVLKKSLDGKVKTALSGFFNKSVRDGDKYLDKVMTAFNEVYTLLKNGEYQKEMPEFANAVRTVRNLGFMDTAIDVLAQYGLVDKNKYRAIKQSIRKKAGESEKALTNYISQYAGLKTAAAVIALFGAGLLLFAGAKLTGFVIGGSFNPNLGFISAILLFIASLILLKKK